MTSSDLQTRWRTSCVWKSHYLSTCNLMLKNRDPNHTRSPTLDCQQSCAPHFSVSFLILPLSFQKSGLGMERHCGQKMGIIIKPLLLVWGGCLVSYPIYVVSSPVIQQVPERLSLMQDLATVLILSSNFTSQFERAVSTLFHHWGESSLDLFFLDNYKTSVFQIQTIYTL